MRQVVHKRKLRGKRQEADKIANQEIKKVSMSYKSRIRRMKGEHKEAVNIRDQYILFALIAAALSVVIPLIEKHSYAINWVIGVNAAYLTYMVIQLIRFIKYRKRADDVD